MTEFAKAVKTKMIEKDMSQKELTEKVSEKIGISSGQPYICRIISGKARSVPVENAIKEILEIKD